MSTDQPVLPYGSGENASSGHSGGATSQERAETADRDGTTARRQAEVLGLLTHRGPYGATWREYAALANLHHGQASGTLSNLHKVGKIARLRERRARCFIYVLPQFVNGRGTQEQGRAFALTEEERITLKVCTDALAEGWTVGNRRAEELVRIIERLTGEKFLEEA